MAFIGLAFTLSAQTLWADSNLKVSEIIRQDLRFCESTYPYDGGILVANFGSGQLDPLNAEGRDISTGIKWESKHIDTCRWKSFCSQGDVGEGWLSVCL